MGRGKRQVSSAQRERKQEGGGSNAPRTSTAGSGIEKLIQDVKEKLTGAKDFWNYLPRTICAEEAAPVDEVSNCWNGVGKHRYDYQLLVSIKPSVGHPCTF